MGRRWMPFVEGSEQPEEVFRANKQCRIGGASIELQKWLRAILG
jgi:hypothetical protein